jgi:hypothetical protein
MKQDYYPKKPKSRNKRNLAIGLGIGALAGGAAYAGGLFSTKKKDLVQGNKSNSVNSWSREYQPTLRNFHSITGKDFESTVSKYNQILDPEKINAQQLQAIQQQIKSLPGQLDQKTIQKLEQIDFKLVNIMSKSSSYQVLEKAKKELYKISLRIVHTEMARDKRIVESLMTEMLRLNTNILIYKKELDDLLKKDGNAEEITTNLIQKLVELSTILARLRELDDKILDINLKIMDKLDKDSIHDYKYYGYGPGNSIYDALVKVESKGKSWEIYEEYENKVADNIVDRAVRDTLVIPRRGTVASYLPCELSAPINKCVDRESLLPQGRPPTYDEFFKSYIRRTVDYGSDKLLSSKKLSQGSKAMGFQQNDPKWFQQYKKGNRFGGEHPLKNFIKDKIAVSVKIAHDAINGAHDPTKFNPNGPKLTRKVLKQNPQYINHLLHPEV